MSTTTPRIPGVDREDLIKAIPRNTVLSDRAARRAADAALAHIAAHHECACDREHADEWVEVDEIGRTEPPKAPCIRCEGDRTPKATPAEALTFLMNKEK